MNNSDIWHKRLDHISSRSLNETIVANGVLRILKLKVDPGKMCGPCQLGKQVRSSHKVTQHLSTTRTLELLHMDLIRPMHVEILKGKRYAFMCVDYFSRYSWVYFLKEKSYTFDAFEALFIKLTLEKNPHHKKVVRIRSDHGKEFENSYFDNF